MSALAVCAIGLAGVAAAAGSAGAVVSIGVPRDGMIGVGFNHDETVALSHTPLPGLLGTGLLAPITVPDTGSSGTVSSFSGGAAVGVGSPFPRLLSPPAVRHLAPVAPHCAS
jgi:hypothetical protein